MGIPVFGQLILEVVDEQAIVVVHNKGLFVVRGLQRVHVQLNVISTKKKS